MKIFGIILVSLFLSGCVGDLSTCIYDPKYLLADVKLRTCDTSYEFSYNENKFWQAKEDIASECRNMEIIATTINAVPAYAANYRAGSEQSAVTFKVHKKDDVINIDSIFTTMRKRGETCPQQFERHESRRKSMEKRLAESAD